MIKVECSVYVVSVCADRRSALSQAEVHILSVVKESVFVISVCADGRPPLSQAKV